MIVDAIFYGMLIGLGLAAIVFAGMYRPWMSDDAWIDHWRRELTVAEENAATCRRWIAHYESQKAIWEESTGD